MSGKLNDIGFWKMKERYAEPVTDLPSTIVTARTGQDQKNTVEDYGGAAPPELIKLEKEIDDYAETLKWKKVAHLEDEDMW